MKTFKDLEFKPHDINIKDHGASRITFENDYGVSVIYGESFYSSGKGSYEVAITYNGRLTYNTYITDDVLCYQSKEQVTKVMKQVQELK